jgi:hypothetical protein
MRRRARGDAKAAVANVVANDAASYASGPSWPMALESQMDDHTTPRTHAGEVEGLRFASRRACSRWTATDLGWSGSRIGARSSRCRPMVDPSAARGGTPSHFTARGISGARFAERDRKINLICRDLMVHPNVVKRHVSDYEPSSLSRSGVSLSSYSASNTCPVSRGSPMPASVRRA